MLKKFRTYQMAIRFYKGAQKLKLPRHLKDQMDRASSSVVLNLAEGSGKRTSKDQRRFYSISLGSLRECQAIMELIEVDIELINLADHIGACLYKLCYPQLKLTQIKA
ncbi:MAG: four helix bundle protein [Bacteriovoracaceae bacterium]|nr:four helix bundle protein [Bacteriovoracaceae bacterium]